MKGNQMDMLIFILEGSFLIFLQVYPSLSLCKTGKSCDPYNDTTKKKKIREIELV